MSIFELIVCWITWNLKKKVLIEESFEESLNNSHLPIYSEGFNGCKNWLLSLEMVAKNFAAIIEKKFLLSLYAFPINQICSRVIMFLFWDLALYLWSIVFLTVLTSFAWVFDRTIPDIDLIPTKLHEFLFFFNNFELSLSQFMTRLCKVIFSYSILKGVQQILFLRNRCLIWIRYKQFQALFYCLE